jgi:NADPH:quinone reductase
MRAWVLDKLGSISNLRLTEIPAPLVKSEEVLMNVIYAGLNPADRYLAEGQYPARPPLPHVLGRDGVGRISAIGPGAGQFKPGDIALIIRGPIGVERQGTFAQSVAVPISSLAGVPTGWSLQQAGGASLTYLTAFQALTQWGDLAPCVVLVTGASGGVGVAAVQLAVASGHTVVALSRSLEKREKLRELGAHITADPTDTQWRRRVLDALNDRRVDLVVESIGGPLFSELLDVMGIWGRISVVGRLAGPVPQFNTASLFFRRLRIGGVAVGTYTTEEALAAFETVLALLAKTGAKPVVDQVFDFSELPAAFEKLAVGPMGKVLLQVAPEDS